MLFDTDSGGKQSYEIKQSLRFRSAQYLSRSHVAGDRTKWTWSGWVKRGKLTTAYLPLFSANVAGGDILWFDGSDVLQLWQAGVGARVSTSTVFRDVASHSHILLAVDTTQTLAIDRFKIFVNGSQVTVTNPVATAQNSQLTINAASQHMIGAWLGTYFFDGLLSEIHFVDGQALTASSFGQANASTGAWEPKKYTGTYGTNGFYLPFNDGSNLTNLCQDRSGNGNNWTATSISLTAGATYDWFSDTPTNNFAALNPLNTTGTLADGNLAASGSDKTFFSTIAMSQGKWYWEGAVTANNVRFGISDGASLSAVYQSADGWKYINGAGSAYGASYNSTNVVGIAFDADAGTLEFFKNGVSQGIAQSGITGTRYAFVLTGTGGAIVINFGQRPFSYTPPTGFKALCSANLPDVAMTTSGTFTGNASANGPFVYLNGVPISMTIDGSAVTWGTHADKLANGFKIRTASSPYNDASSNSYVVTVAGSKFKYANAQVNS